MFSMTGEYWYILLAQILFGTACATIADWKGRWFWGWAIFGYVTGPIALLIIAIMPKKREGSHEGSHS
jgi:hypothetical protein